MLHTAGEEVVVDLVAGARSQPPSPWYVGLYDTATDALHDDHTHDAITTEPDYDGPAQVTWPDDMATEQLDDVVAGSGLYVIDVTAGIEFDITSATTSVDSYYVAADTRSAVLGQASVQRNLLWTGDLDDRYDLDDDPTDVFPLEGVRVGFN